MCGIAGIFRGPDPCGDLADESAIVARMTAVLAHRGPDGSGSWQDLHGRCTLGHRRLSILDLTDAGAQPMSRPSTPWVLSFNGEIYNADELRLELEAVGRRFRGHADTEVLLAAIHEWGLDALPRLDGMFAFAAFNEHTGELILARDPFGEKPLYYSDVGRSGLAFASELTAIETLPWFQREVPRERMAEMLMFQYIGAPRTIYRDASKLPPGHFMHVSRGGTRRIEPYFAFKPTEPREDTLTMWDAVDELEAVLVRSLRRRLRSDVPLGALLSGGVDSATACALIRRVLNVPLQTFSLGFQGAADSETGVASAFARVIGSEHRELVLDESAVGFLRDIGSRQDEPNGDVSCFPTYLLSQSVREHVGVALSGDGGDEMFGGYARYLHAVSGISDRPFGPFGREYYSLWILPMNELEIRALFGDMDPMLRAHLDALRRQLDEGRHDALAAMRTTDAANYLPGAVLAKVDRMTMQHSLEVRTPYLSPDVAAFAARLPNRLLADRQSGKLILRELACRYLPHDLVSLPKKGFGLPPSWGGEAIASLLKERLQDRRSRLRSTLGAPAIDRFLSRPYRLEPAWGMLTLESWCRVHDAHLAPPDASAQRARSARWLTDKTLLLVDDDFLDGERFAEVDGSTDVGAGVAARTLELFRGVRPLIADEDAPGDPQWVQLPANVSIGEGLQNQGIDVSGARVVWFSGDAYAGPRRHRVSMRWRGKDLSVRVGLSRWDVQGGRITSAAAEVGPAAAVLVVNPLDDSTDRPIVWHHRRLDRRRLRAARERLVRARSGPQWQPSSEAEQLAAHIRSAAPASNHVAPPLRSAVVLTNALSGGGAERQWCYLATGLAERGVKVTFVSLDRIGGPDAQYASLLGDPRVRVRELPDVGSPDLLGYVNVSDVSSPLQHQASRFGDMVLRLTCVLREEAPNALFAQLDDPNVIGAGAALSAGVPAIVCSFRNYSPEHLWFDGNHYLPAYRALCEREQVMLSGNSAPGNADYARWLGVAPDAIRVIPNGVAGAAGEVACRAGGAQAGPTRDGVRATLGIDPVTPVVLGAFRLSPEKRPELFVATCARVAESMPNLCVLLAGRGTLDDHTRRLASRYGFDESSFRLLGSRSDLDALLAASDALLLTSRVEGMPNVVLEAQMAGLPVIAPSVGSVAEIVVDGATGIVVAEPITSSAMAAALQEVLASPARWRERVQKHRVELMERFSIAAMVEAYQDLPRNPRHPSKGSSVRERVL